MEVRVVRDGGRRLRIVTVEVLFNRAHSARTHTREPMRDRVTTTVAWWLAGRILR